MKFKINAKSSRWILQIVTRLVLIESLGHAENSDTIVLFELLLDLWSDFHQNRIISSSDHAD